MKLASVDQHFHLLVGQRVQQIVARVWSIMEIASVVPTVYGRVGHAILTSQFTITDTKLCLKSRRAMARQGKNRRKDGVYVV